MSLTPSNRHVNAYNCTFTPASGSAVAIKGVTSVALAYNNEVLKGSGDGDYFNSLATSVSEDPSVSLDTNETAWMSAVAPGTVGVLTWTKGDAINKAVTAGGALIYTISNAIFAPQTDTTTHRQFSTAGYQFVAFAPDGLTSPIAVAAA